MTERAGRARDRASWEQHYVDDELPWDTGSPDPRLARVLSDHAVAPTSALDIGCGTGTNTVWLARRGFDVTGVDISDTAIDRARARAEEAGVHCEFVRADFLADPLPGPPRGFAYDRGVFHVFEAADRARFAARLAELLEPGAIWHSLAGSTDGPPRDAGPPRISATDVVSAVEPHFEILELSSTRFDDDLHSDARAWVLVARRRG